MTDKEVFEKFMGWMGMKASKNKLCEQNNCG